MEERTCTTCREKLPLNADFFGKARTRYFKGFMYRCISCNRVRSRTKHLRDDPKHSRARRLLQSAVRRGEVKKEPCVKCGKIKAHGHHPDYDKPLEVLWLCQKHHVELHNQLRRISN